MSESIPAAESRMPHSPGPLRVLRRSERDPLDDPTGEALLERSRRPWEVWVPARSAVVLGNSQDPESELDVAAVLRDGIPVHRRMGGGGAVVLSSGCVCLALRFRKRKELSIHDYFAAGSAVVNGMVRQRLGTELFLRGISDLACATPAGERKVAGSSLYMPRDFALYLVSILVAPDLREIARYLSHPSREPDYRAGRPHGDFLAGLAALAKDGLEPNQVAEWLKESLPGTVQGELDWP